MPAPPQTLRHLLGAPYRGGGLSFSTCGTSLFVSLGGRVQRLDLTAGRARTLPFEATRDLHTISLSPRGDVLLAVDSLARATLLALPSGRVAARLSLRLPQVTAASVSPCATMVAISGPDAVEVWRVPDSPVPAYAAFDRVARFNRGAAAKGALCWSADSKHVAVGSRDGVATVFTIPDHAAPGVRVRPLVLYGHREAVVFVRFCGKRGLVTMSSDGVLFCWRLRENSASVEEGSHADGQTRVVVPLGAKLMSKHFVRQGGASRAKCAALHQQILTVGMSNGVFALYQLPEEMAGQESEAFDAGLFEIGEMRKRKRAREGMNAADVSKKAGEEDGSEDEEEDDILDETVPRIGFTDLTLLHTLSASGNAITDIEFNPTGEWIALASSQSGQIVIWEWRSETHILKQQSHVLAANAAAFSPDGRAIATGSRDGRVKLWGVATGFCVATFTEHEASVSAVAFAAKDVIVTASLDGTVRAFDIRRYRNFRVMVGPPPRRQFGCVAVDAAGDLIAAGCIDTFEVIVWSLRTGQVLEVLSGHKGPVSGIAFRPRRGTLATSSWDRTVRLWDMYERKGNSETLEHSKEVLAVCFRPDGKEFAACTASGEIVLWDSERGTITGTIDGSRDAASGRLRESRTAAPLRGHFQTLSYSADGRFLLAGASSKHVCMYHVPEGSRPTLVNKVVVTENQAFDGLLDRLNSKNLTISGHAMDTIADDDVEAEDYGEARLAERNSLPGAASELKLRRKKLLKAEVKCVHACPTGRLWSAVTTEGVIVYSDASGNGTDGVNDSLFDPTNLEVDITPEAAEKAARRRDYVAALTIALRLNEKDCLNAVVEKIPAEDINLVVDRVSSVYFSRLILLFAWRLDNTPHLEFNLRWAKRLLMAQGADAHNHVSDPAVVNTALRALQRACAAHSKRIMPLADRNEHMLKYLVTTAKRKKATEVS
ncbi:WD40-repeat containing protein [Chondrus crispus]|uniref:WD40-repeat containing protein n=1 Tax=Chondrus crispus TaxID=2769 RepID=R7QVG7_CHOCR|nr:WD40-repeat containing protein [Chondrus crispus]CDF41330.1 WD40-repeat containing protein [Chondrus crispus]|eukprot:XP_005711624.1 WD40-repeat containing protein [Chondrus crispus]